MLDEVRPVGSAPDPHDDAVSDVVDLQAASEAPLPDPAELADPEHPIPAEGPDAVVASPDDATVAAELPVTDVEPVESILPAEHDVVDPVVAEGSVLPVISAE